MFVKPPQAASRPPCRPSQLSAAPGIGAGGQIQDREIPGDAGNVPFLSPVSPGTPESAQHPPGHPTLLLPPPGMKTIPERPAALPAWNNLQALSHHQLLFAPIHSIRLLIKAGSLISCDGLKGVFSSVQTGWELGFEAPFGMVPSLFGFNIDSGVLSIV